MLTQADIEAEISRIAHLLEARTETYADYASQAAEAEHAYRVGYAKAVLLSQQSTVAMREADATVQVGELLRQRRQREAVADATKESLRSFRDQLSAMQSLLRAVKEQT
jgi:hypothetical protein